jgi:hypothetical protein
MSKFKCINKDCKNFDKPVEVATLNWPYELESKRIKDMNCKECDTKMSSIPFESSNKAPAHAKFNSLPDDKKKEILGKRANEAYLKEGGPEKQRHTQQQAIKRMGGRS